MVVFSFVSSAGVGLPWPEKFAGDPPGERANARGEDPGGPEVHPRQRGQARQHQGAVRRVRGADVR